MLMPSIFGENMFDEFFTRIIISFPIPFLLQKIAKHSNSHAYNNQKAIQRSNPTDIVAFFLVGAFNSPDYGRGG